MAGTTVADDGLVERAFTVAMVHQGVEIGTPAFEEMLAVVRETMGQSKIEVFRRLSGGDETAAEKANAAFEQAYSDLVREGAVKALPDAAAAIARLRRAGIPVTLTTGFAKPTQDAIVDALGWRDAIDGLICPSADVRGRPHPDMVLAAAAAAGVDDLATVVVAGDTPSDIAAGLRAGAGLVVGVLTGTGDAAALTAAGAHAVIDTIGDLPHTLGLH
jgi:phosphoglycolate phosphatase